MPVWVNRETGQSRFDICKNCEHFIKTANTCKKCGCFMKVKVKLIGSVCPVGKW